MPIETNSEQIYYKEIFHCWRVSIFLRHRRQMMLFMSVSCRRRTREEHQSQCLRNFFDNSLI